MAGEQKPERVIPIRVNEKVVCHHCGNDNLIHGLTLAKADGRMMAGGPGQLPNFISDKWAVYLCIQCGGFYPYKKQYPGQPYLQKLYRQIHDWCDAKSKERLASEERLKQLVSIIESNKDLLGLPGPEQNDELDKVLRPLQDQLDELKREVYKKRGGRPRQCKLRNCKIKAEIDGLCRKHFIEGQK